MDGNLRLSDALIGYLLDVRPRDKSQLIGEVARAFGRLVPGLTPEAVEAALLAREQLGSTGLGAGFALPHARIEGLGGYLGLFVRLAKPIDFDAIDGKPVDAGVRAADPFGNRDSPCGGPGGDLPQIP